MKKILIAYSSKTGNTEKIAQALYEGHSDTCELKKVTEIQDANTYDVVFVGYWVDKGGPDAKAKALLSTLKGKKVVLFQTLGAEAYSEHGRTSFANAAKYLSSDCMVLGTLSIQGAIDPQLIAAMSKMPAGSPHAPSEASKKRWAAASTHPDAADLQTAKEYMQNFLATYERFYSKM